MCARRLYLTMVTILRSTTNEELKIGEGGIDGRVE